MLWILLRKISERIYGVARLGHPKLHIGGPEVIMILNGKLDHFESIKLMDEGLAFFEGILRADHKPHFV